MSIKTPTSSIENQSKFEQQDPTVRICVPSRNEYIALMLQNGGLKTRKISQRYYKSQGQVIMKMLMFYHLEQMKYRR